MPLDRAPIRLDSYRAGLRAAVAATLLALGLGARPVAANDLSTSPCTANDVEIVGSGLVINEPCTCPAGGTFSATVRFVVRNNTNTGRYCVSLHLVPDGVVLAAPFDVVLRDVNGSSTASGRSGGEPYHDTVMYGSIPGFPCTTGMVCFGGNDVVSGKCAPLGCSTVSWNTSPGQSACTTADQNPPGGQCRHQRVCIVGFGATLACATGCNVTCGGTSTLTACVVAPASRGPFTLEVQGDDGSALQSQSTVGDASGTTCLTFTVSPTKSPSTTYTLTVRDAAGCTRTATASIAVTVTTVAITPPAAPGCNGILTYSAAVSGLTGCSFSWSVDGHPLKMFLTGAADDARVARVSGTNFCTFEFRALDGVCHSVEVAASCSASGQAPCVARASTTATQCATTSQGCAK
jgi:hypothetical protein